ncbi:hypothetical protein Tco_0222573, partial [Tanacetum coccineum]
LLIRIIRFSRTGICNMCLLAGAFASRVLPLYLLLLALNSSLLKLLLSFGHTLGYQALVSYLTLSLNWLADACGPNVDIETTLVQQSGVSPAEETSVLAVVRREFTPPFEEGVRAQNIGVSQNVRRCLLPCFSAAAGSSNRFPPTVEPRIQTVAAVDVRNTSDRNCIPISRVFNMRATSDQAEYMTQTASCSRPLAVVDSRNRGSVYTAVVPVFNVPKAASAGLISNNTMKNLQHTELHTNQLRSAAL